MVALFYSKNSSLSKSGLGKTCLWKRVVRQRDFWGPQKKIDVDAHWAGKPSQSLDCAGPDSDRLCTDGGNSRPFSPSIDVVQM